MGAITALKNSAKFLENNEVYILNRKNIFSFFFFYYKNKIKKKI